MTYRILKTISNRLFATVFAALSALFVLGCEVPDSADLSFLGSGTQTEKVATPTANPASGSTIGFGGTITLATTTPSADIYYKLGVTPAIASPPPGTR
jgi:hypothetical protein